MSDLHPTRTVVTSFNPRATTASIQPCNNGDYFEEGDWVLCVAALRNHWIGCALSNGEIQVYDPSRLHLLQTYQQPHASSSSSQCITSDLVSTASVPHLLATSNTSGKVCLWDVRQPARPALACTPEPSASALSVSLGYDGVLAAVGTSKAKIHFVDLRNAGAKLGSYENAHTDEVTKVRFQPTSTGGTTPVLVSASEDGLVCLFDTTQATEDAALERVLNVQSPARKVGFFGPQHEGLYCLTGSETMSLWHFESAQRICEFGRTLSNMQDDEDTPYYLVNCEWDASRNELQLLTATQSGDEATLFQVDPGLGKLTCLHRLSGGHRGVVRDWCSLSSNVLLTVGEDARLCEWNRMGRQLSSSSLSGTKAIQPVVGLVPPRMQQTSATVGPTRGGGPLRRQRNRRPSGPY